MRPGLTGQAILAIGDVVRCDITGDLGEILDQLDVPQLRELARLTDLCPHRGQMQMLAFAAWKVARRPAVPAPRPTHNRTYLVVAVTTSPKGSLSAVIDHEVSADGRMCDCMDQKLMSVCVARFILALRLARGRLEE